MPTHSSEIHDCKARNQPKIAEWQCPVCGLEWFGRQDGIGFVWETAEAKNLRESLEQEIEDRKDATPPPTLNGMFVVDDEEGSDI